MSVIGGVVGVVGDVVFFLLVVVLPDGVPVPVPDDPGKDVEPEEVPDPSVVVGPEPGPLYGPVPVVGFVPVVPRVVPDVPASPVPVIPDVPTPDGWFPRSPPVVVPLMPPGLSSY